jgi:hypothetical protein
MCACTDGLFLQRNVQKQKMKAVMREKDALEQQLKQQQKSAMQMQMRKDAMHSDNDDLEVEVSYAVSLNFMSLVG